MSRRCACDPAGPVLLLPGSRQQAVARIFPALLAGHRALGERPAAALYPSEEIGEQLRRMAGRRDAARVTLLPAGGGPGRGPLGASAVLTSSGTMSMHCALAGIPGAVVYRANPLTYLIGRRLVKVPHLGIANLLLEEPMYPEFIQGAATPAALAAELHACLHDPVRRERARIQAGELRAVLSRPTGGTAADWLERRLA